MAVAARSFTRRETCPPSHRRWIEEQQDQFTLLEQDFQRWLGQILEMERVSASNLYENVDATETDFRYHRLVFFWAMHEGERIALGFSESEENPERYKGYIEAIDQKNDSLFRALLDWHMPVDYRDELPETLKRSMAQAAKGKLLDFPSEPE
jgi:hypothetical protein